MAGRPALRIGDHGKISRRELSKGTWLARCRFRDTDGVKIAHPFPALAATPYY